MSGSIPYYVFPWGSPPFHELSESRNSKWGELFTAILTFCAKLYFPILGDKQAIRMLFVSPWCFWPVGCAGVPLAKGQVLYPPTNEEHSVRALCFLKNNPISNHTDSRVRLWNHSIPAGNRSVEVLSAWNRMGESQCLFTLGPLGELWWGFVRCESHHHISHQPLTAAKHWLGLSMQASAQLGSIPYIFLKKVWSILGEESACYAGGEMGAALPALTSEQPPSTHSHPVSSLLLPRWEAGQRIFPFALRKPMDGWCQPTVWWLLYFSRHGVSRYDK